MNSVIITILIFAIIYYLYVSGSIHFAYNQSNENFLANLSIVDPYSMYLYDNITEKQNWWNVTHSKKLYYYHDYVPTIFKE